MKWKSKMERNIPMCLFTIYKSKFLSEMANFYYSNYEYNGANISGCCSGGKLYRND